MKSNRIYNSGMLLILLFVFDYSAFAQVGRPYRIIKTNEYMENLAKNDSTVLNKQIEYEEYYHEILTQNISVENNIIIPIVFHILLPEYDNITVETIETQIDELNKNFNFGESGYYHQAIEGEGFVNLKENIQVNFCLAKNDGKPAIFVYPHDKRWKYENNELFSEKSGIKVIDPKHYLNIIICNLDDGVSGFAQMPCGVERSDAVIIDKDFFYGGRHKDYYGQGKTLVHLVGNFFNLKSLWQKDCQDDGVLDTPIHNSPNFDCPDYKHITTCQGNAVEMTMNYMDNTDDECLSLFTKGQQQRFYATVLIGGPRSGFNNDYSYCEIIENRNKLSTRVEIFPNPASGIINAIFEDQPRGGIRIKLFNAQGIQILDNNYNDKWVKIILPQNAEGIHVIEISEAGKIITTKKIIIVKN